jgi:hypothetical protein
MSCLSGRLTVRLLPLSVQPGRRVFGTRTHGVGLTFSCRFGVSATTTTGRIKSNTTHLKHPRHASGKAAPRLSDPG